jgi:hypothetical protein
MKLNVDAPVLRPWLRALQPSLPMLATRAAVELDTLRRGNQSDMEAVRELSELLKNSFEQEYENDGTHRAGSLLDPSTMLLVGRAIATIPDKRVTKVAEVQQIILEVAKWLDETAANASPGRAVVLRDFCLELARGASSHHRDFRDEKPTHPYRR